MKLIRLLGLCLSTFLLGAGLARADTLYFIATRDINGVVDFDWFSGNNWYVPDPLNPGKFAHAARIPVPTDTADILTTVNAAANNINLAGLYLDEANGDYNVGATVNGGNFIVGTLQMHEGSSFNGSSIEVSHQLIANNASTLLDVQLTIQSGASALLTKPTPDAAGLYITGSTIYNIGEIVLQDGATLTASADGTRLCSFVNASGATLSGSGATAVLGGRVLSFDNAGTVRCDSGTLLLDGLILTNSTTNFAKFKTTATNATIDLDNNLTFPAGATYVFSGPGLSRLKAGPDTVLGALQVGIVDPATQMFDAGTLECAADLSGGGTLHVLAQPGLPSVLNWDGSTISLPLVTIDAGARLNLFGLSGSEGWSLFGGVLNSSGTTTWNGNSAGNQSQFALDNGAIFNNLAGALFDVKTNGTLIGGNMFGSGTNAVTFNNAGTFRKSAGTNDLNFYPIGGENFIFNNTGLLDVQAGRVDLGGGVSSGMFNVAAGAQLRFASGLHVLAPGATLTGPGSVALGTYNGPSPRLMLNEDVAIANFIMDDNNAILDGPGNLAISGSFIWSGGTMQGIGNANIVGNATVSISGGNLHRTLNNSGNAILSVGAGGGIYAGNGAAFNNLAGATCVLPMGGSFGYDGLGAAPSFNNAGNLGNSQGFSPTFNLAFTNSGSVLVRSNGITFLQNYTQVAGSTVVNAGAIIQGGAHPVSAMLIQGGTLSGSGIINDVVSNTATVRPGSSPGILTLEGYPTTYSQGAGGTLDIEIGGLTPGTQYSRLDATASSGTVALGGTLQVSLVNGFNPAVGDTFAIVTYGSRSGTFANVIGNYLASGMVLIPRYTATNMALVAAVLPGVSSLAPQGGGYKFNFFAYTGFPYIAEYTDLLGPQTQWLALTNLSGNGSAISVFDQAPSRPQRYYRVRLH